jgi:hypothetical protein
MDRIITLVLWATTRVRRDEAGVGEVMQSVAIGVVGIILLLAFLPPARTLMADVVTWVRDSTIGA